MYKSCQKISKFFLATLILLFTSEIFGQLVIAHRGFSGKYPENTMLAFEEAIRQHVHYIEMDVRMSKDDSIMIIHDETIDRTTDAKGKVSDYTYLELKEMDAGYSDKFGNKFIGEKIPTLFEILQNYNGTVDYVIDSKNVPEVKIIEILQSLKLENHLIISSYNENKIRRISQNYPNIKTALIVNQATSSSVDIALDVGAKMIITSPYISGSCFRYAKKKNLEISFGIINSPQQIPNFVKDSEYGIVTDFPDLIFQSVENPFIVYMHKDKIIVEPKKHQERYHVRIFNLEGQVFYQEDNLKGLIEINIKCSTSIVYVLIRNEIGVYSFPIIVLQ